MVTETYAIKNSREISSRRNFSLLYYLLEPASGIPPPPLEITEIVRGVFLLVLPHQLVPPLSCKNRVFLAAIPDGGLTLGATVFLTGHGGFLCPRNFPTVRRFWNNRFHHPHFLLNNNLTRG